MERDDFHIGLEFWCGDGQWRCTDIGTRVIVAIRVDSGEISTFSNGNVTTRSLTRAEAEAIGWFNGPPYGVVESVFDEFDLEGCSLEPDSAIDTK